MSRRNTGSGSNATLCAVLLVWGVAAAASGDISAPAPGEVMLAYQTVDGWVRDWEVPQLPGLEDPEGTTGACVTLRYRGAVLGRGTVIADDGAAIWRAARDAWLDARVTPGISDAMEEGVLNVLVSRRIMLDLQVAGRQVPLGGRTFGGVTAGVSPGYHGLAARLGSRSVALFPGEQLERTIDPATSLRMLAAVLELPAVELDDLRARGFTPYRFMVTHLAQPAPDAEPLFLQRGGRLVPATEAMRMQGLSTFADRLAAHLLTHLWTGPEPHGLRGSYELIDDEYDPDIAPAREQAMVAMALSEYSVMPGAAMVTAHEARSAARRIMLDLSYVTEFETDPLADVEAAGAVVLALARIRRNDPSAWMVEPALEELARQATDRLRRTMQADGWAKGVPPALGAMIACALASAEPWDADGESRRASAEILRLLLRATPATDMIGLMPWAIWCEQELHEAGEEIPSAVALDESRKLLWQFQLRSEDLDPHDADLAGGIVLSKGPTPLPTSLSARPIAGMAAMLGDTRLTPDADVPTEIGRVAEAVRFLMQLSVREGEAHLASSHRRALGGIRQSLWDYKISLDATSMSLIATCEALKGARNRLSGGDNGAE